MVKYTINIILLLLLTLDCSAQWRRKKSRSAPKKVDTVAIAIEQRKEVSDYYTANRLNVDSSTSTYLYYKIYDWIGTQYCYAGNGPKGIDCSGFVKKIYKEVYCIDLSGGSKDIFTTVTPVHKDSLKEGDMVFFRIRHGQVSHMGIYLGNNKFAHAAVKGGVMVNDLDEPYYKKYFYKGGRP